MRAQINVRDLQAGLQDHELNDEGSCWCNPTIVVVAVRKNGRAVKMARHRSGTATTLARQNGPASVD